MTGLVLRDRRVLVTGAGGCVGHAVSNELARAGAEVLAVGRATIDLAAEHAADRLRRELGTIDAVVHLAAAVPNRPEWPDDEASATLTRRIDRAVADATDAWDCPVVYTSTVSVYDRRDPARKTEDAPVAAHSPYVGAKLDGEACFGGRPGTCIARISGPCGPGMRDTTVMARFVALARAHVPITVWGTGRREQDFVDARDLAGFARIALETGPTGIFNVARGVPTTMRELADAVAARFDGSVEMVARDDPQEGMTARYDIGRAGAAGWSPATTLAETLGALDGVVFAS